MDFLGMFENWKILFAVFPGLVLFLYGIEHFSAEIQSVAGERFRKLLGKLSENRFSGAFLGAIVTAIIQSSTATTVIVTGLVNAGTISFLQSLGITLGASVGTTVTAQLVAFKLTSFAPIFIVLGFLIGLVGGKYRFTGKPIFYFGLVFFSLNLISDSMLPIKDDPAVASFFASLSNVWLAVFVGFIFTAIVQSSSVTAGILVLLSESGLITLASGIPILLGSAIGTTVTTIIASHSMSLHAKRAASAHTLFNLISVAVMLPFISPFAIFIEGLGGGPGQQLANSLTVFKVFFAAIFLIMLKPFKKAIEYAVPGEEEEIIFQTKHLPENMPDSLGESMTLVEMELQHLLNITESLFSDSLHMLKEQDSRTHQRVLKLESLTDYLDKRISGAIMELSQNELEKKDAQKTILLVRISNSIEQLADRAKDFSSTVQKIHESGGKLSPQAKKDLLKAHNIFSKNLRILSRDVREITSSERQKMKKNDKEIGELINSGYRNHLIRMQKTGEGSEFIKLATALESANTKLRDIRKLSQEYIK
jgi:phosphate:Na+ symporter